MVNFRNPVVIAVMIGWIMSVVLHELAHGVVAYAGGDYTIRERGGLTLNPLQYIDPVMSILLPLLFLALGGIPLPGGATYIRTDLLRTRYWRSAVSLAGPATNFILFLAFVLPFHPVIGWIHPPDDRADWSTTQQFLATMGILQFWTVCLNLLPIPPLDGFNAITPFLDPVTRAKLTSPAARQAGIFILVILFFMVPAVGESMIRLGMITLQRLGFSSGQTGDIVFEFGRTLFNWS